MVQTRCLVPHRSQCCHRWTGALGKAGRLRNICQKGFVDILIVCKISIRTVDILISASINSFSIAIIIFKIIFSHHRLTGIYIIVFFMLCLHLVTPRSAVPQKYQHCNAMHWLHLLPCVLKSSLSPSWPKLNGVPP